MTWCRKSQHTCRVGAGNAVAGEPVRANSPHRERVAWSRSQTIDGDYVLFTGNIRSIANQSIWRCRRRAWPCERQWISRRVDKATLSKYLWRWNTTTTISQCLTIQDRSKTILEGSSEPSMFQKSTNVIHNNSFSYFSVCVKMRTLILLILLIIYIK